jgi:hypothetical protein
VANEHDHPTDEAIAAFLDRALSASERQQVSRHLAECDECRALLGAARDARPSTFTMSVRGARRRSAGQFAAAAAAIVLVGIAFRTRPTATAPGRERADRVVAESPVLHPRSPVTGASLFTDTLVLRWDAVGEGATYDVSILDADGSVVWKTRADTADIAPPADVKARLQPGHRYHWQVDAVLPDLRTTTTGPQEFVPLER